MNQDMFIARNLLSRGRRTPGHSYSGILQFIWYFLLTVWHFHLKLWGLPSLQFPWPIKGIKTVIQSLFFLPGSVSSAAEELWRLWAAAVAWFRSGTKSWPELIPETQPDHNSTSFCPLILCRRSQIHWCIFKHLNPDYSIYKLNLDFFHFSSFKREFLSCDQPYLSLGSPTKVPSSHTHRK